MLCKTFKTADSKVRAVGTSGCRNVTDTLWCQLAFCWND